jgi:hypothetical protein
MCIKCFAILLAILSGTGLAVWLTDKLIKLRNRPAHDTESDGRTE